MANEIRLRSNNISGAINDNPLLIGSTTINSPSFADLPVVDSTNHLMITLDPLELNGAAEIVMVTAHSSSATSVTVVRAQEGSTGRQHGLGTTWFHGPVASDYQFQRAHYLSAYRNAAYSINGVATIPFDTISQSDAGISFNTSTGIYTVQVPGTYFASAKLEFNGGGVGLRMILALFMGTPAFRGDDTTNSASGYDTFFAHGIRRLVRGDTIRAEHNLIGGGPTAAAVGSIDVSHFLVYRLGD